VSRLTASLRFTATRVVRHTPTASRLPAFRLLHASAPRAQNESAEQYQNNGKAGNGDKPLDAPRVEKPPSDPKDAEIDRLKAEAVTAKSEAATAKTSLAYALAQVQNVQRAARADHEKAVKFGIQDFAKDLLEVADNLERCIANFPQDLLVGGKPLQDFHLGVTMTQTVLQKALSKHGVERVYPLGQKFDTATMNALMHMRNASKQPGTVGLVTKSGYTLRGRVIRPADVAVVDSEPEAAKAGEASAGSNTSDVS